jgi:hypothetical protein
MKSAVVRKKTKAKEMRKAGIEKTTFEKLGVYGVWLQYFIASTTEDRKANIYDARWGE